MSHAGSRVISQAGAFALTLLAAACSSSSSTPPSSAAATGSAASSSGIDLAGMDRVVNPGDDFWRFANGTWERGTPIPDDRSSWGSGAEIVQQVQQQTRTLLEEAARAPKTGEEKTLGDYYAAFMDEAAIEQRGLAALTPTLARINAIADRRTLARELGAMLRAADDLAHFTTASDRLVEQYSAYRPFADLALNGRQTLSENLADLAGLAAAWDAYRYPGAGAGAGERGGFSANQQFFISYAQRWRQKYREPRLRSQVVADGHAPSMYRAQTVRNIDDWYTAFNVQPGAALFLAPQNRVRIW